MGARGYIVVSLWLAVVGCSRDKPCYYRCVGQDSCGWYNHVTESKCVELAEQECARRTQRGVQERAWSEQPPAWCPHVIGDTD